MKNVQNLFENYKELDLRKLDEKVTLNGIDYYLVERTETKAIYQQEKPAVSFEVFVNKIAPEREAAESFAKRYSTPYDPTKYHIYKEVYPKDEEFGKRAWSYPRLDLAKQKYDSLT